MVTAPLFKAFTSESNAFKKSQRRSEHQARGAPVKQQNKEVRTTEILLSGTQTARSNMLSNGSFPTSLGAGSVMSMNKIYGKTAMGGLMGSNDHAWRKPPNKGVRSETGSDGNIGLSPYKSIASHTSA